MKPSRRASTRRRRKSVSASPQVGTPATPATPFSPVPRDAPRPPCPSNFDPDVWERVVDIAVAASAKDSASRGGQKGTPGWATNAATVARETRERNSEGHPTTDASALTPAILRATSDAHEKKHAEALLVAARAAVAKTADSETKKVDPTTLVRFALLRENMSVRDSANTTNPRGFSARGVTFGAERSATERSEDVFSFREKNVSSPPSAPGLLSERDAALNALAFVRDEHDLEVKSLCVAHENYEAFTAAVAQLGGVRELLRKLATQARAQHDELVAAGAPVLEAEAGAERERAVAMRLARAAKQAHACHTACAVAHEAKVFLDRRRWYDALLRIDELVATHVPRLAPSPPPRSRFALSENQRETRTNDGKRDERKSKSASTFDDDEEDDDDELGTSSKTSRALAAALLEDCARARDAALRGADADATQWLVAARAAAAAAGARALAVVDRRDETSARALASDASGDVHALVRASVERTRARGAAAAAAARRAAVDVLAAAEGAKAARRAAESVGSEGTRVDEAPRSLASDASASFLSRAGGSPTTNLQRRIDFTAEAAAEDRDGHTDARRSAVSLDKSAFPSVSDVGSAERDPFFVFDGATSVEAPATAPLRAALQTFAAVGLGARFAKRVKEQRALQLRAEMRYDVSFFSRDSKGSADDALRRLINETLAKFVGHFVVDASTVVALDLAYVRPDAHDAGKKTNSRDDTRDVAENFAAALRELETYVVAAVAAAEQAAVCRAAVAAVERACFALTRLGPGFESAPRLRDAAARAAKSRVVALLTKDTTDACAFGDDARRLLTQKPKSGASPDPPLSAFAAELASSAEAFAAETGAFLGGLVRGDGGAGCDAEARDAVATARRATRRCVERMAETCALPLFFSKRETEREDAESTTLRTGADEASAARLIADAAWLDARVDGWCALAAEAATNAFRANDASTRAFDDETLSASEVETFASDAASTETPSPFGATARACERALLRMVRAHVASATAATTLPGEWAPARAPTGPSERASAVAAYFYGTLRRALETPGLPAAAATFARVARASLSLCADFTLQTMENDSLTKTVNAHGLLLLRHDLEAFEHVARTLAETALSTTEALPRGEAVGDALVASLGSVRVLLSLCADPSGTTEGGSPVSAFVTDAFAAHARGDDDGENGDAGETPFLKPLTRARAARILEKYRDVPLGKGADPSATAFVFASKKRVDAVVKALKAR